MIKTSPVGQSSHRGCFFGSFGGFFTCEQYRIKQYFWGDDFRHVPMKENFTPLKQCFFSIRTNGF